MLGSLSCKRTMTESLDESITKTKETSSRDHGRIVRATVWTLIAYVLSNALRLISNLILARLLFPEAFALLALASILTQGLKMFSDIGIGPSIIQSARGNDPEFQNTAWTMQIIRGVWLFVAACGLTYPFALFYNTPALLWVIPVAAFPSAISGFNSTTLFTMNRQLTMGKLAMLQLGESIVKLIVTVVWAIVHPSVWAILGGVIVSRVFYTAASHWLLPTRRHRLTWNSDAARELLRFGGWVFLSTAVTFFAQQVDRLMLGKLIPLELLGVYSIALMFSRLPLDICSTVTGQVLFPVLASITRTDPGRMKKAITESRRIILTIGAAVTVALMTASPWFFYLAYDQRYQEAIWITPFLGGTLWFGILQASCDRALLAFGDTRSLFLSNLMNFIVTVTACLVGFHAFGMPGFIGGVGLGNLVGHVVIALRLAMKKLLKVHQDLMYTAAVAAAGIIGVWLPESLSMNLSDTEGLVRLVWQGSLTLIAGVVTIKTALSLASKRQPDMAAVKKTST